MKRINIRSSLFTAIAVFLQYYFTRDTNRRRVAPICQRRRRHRRGSAVESETVVNVVSFANRVLVASSAG